MALILRRAAVVIRTVRVFSSGGDANITRCVVSQGDRKAYLYSVVDIEVVVLLVRKIINCGPTLVMTICWLQLCFIRE